MPSNRKRTPRTPEKSLVSQRALELFADAFLLTPIRNAHRGGDCGEDAPNRYQRCEACRRHIEVSQALHLELGLKPWEVSPLDVPAKPITPTSNWEKSYPKAQAIRKQMLNALAETEAQCDTKN